MAEPRSEPVKKRPVHELVNRNTLSQKIAVYRSGHNYPFVARFHSKCHPSDTSVNHCRAFVPFGLNRREQMACWLSRFAHAVLTDRGRDLHDMPS